MRASFDATRRLDGSFASPLPLLLSRLLLLRFLLLRQQTREDDHDVEDAQEHLRDHHHVVLGGNHLQMSDKTTQLEETKKRGQFIDPDDDIYVVYYDGNRDPISTQAYAFKSKRTGEIRLLSDWIFLVPEDQEQPEEEEFKIGNQIIYLLPKKEEPGEKFGYVKWSSPKLEELGLEPGDKVLIRKNADYEMEVDGERLYRTFLKSIHGKVEEV